MKISHLIIASALLTGWASHAASVIEYRINDNTVRIAADNQEISIVSKMGEIKHFPFEYEWSYTGGSTTYRVKDVRSGDGQECLFVYGFRTALGMFTTPFSDELCPNHAVFDSNGKVKKLDPKNSEAIIKIMQKLSHMVGSRWRSFLDATR